MGCLLRAEGDLATPLREANVLCVWIHSQTHLQDATNIYIGHIAKNFKILRGSFICAIDLASVLLLTLKCVVAMPY